MSNQETMTLKKGHPTWRPANVVDVIDKEPGYRYRLIEKSPRNLAKKEREGWEILSKVTTQKTTAESGYGRINEGTPMTSVLEGYDYVVGRIPEALAKSRDEYMNNESSRRMSSLKRQAAKDLGGVGGVTHGSISLEKKGVRTIIKD